MYGSFNFKNCLSSIHETSETSVFYFIFFVLPPFVCFFFSMFIRHILESCNHAHSVLTFAQISFFYSPPFLFGSSSDFTLQISTLNLSHPIFTPVCSAFYFHIHILISGIISYFLIDLFHSNLCICVCSIFSGFSLGTLIKVLFFKNSLMITELPLVLLSVCVCLYVCMHLFKPRYWVFSCHDILDCWMVMM